MSITVEYHGGKWMVRGVWNSTNKEQLMDRMKAIQSAKNKEAGNHREDQASLREIEQLRQQLRDALQENTRLTTTVNGLQVQLETERCRSQQQTKLEGTKADLQTKKSSPMKQIFEKMQISNEKMQISNEKMPFFNRKDDRSPTKRRSTSAINPPDTGVGKYHCNEKMTSFNETTQQYVINSERLLNITTTLTGRSRGRKWRSLDRSWVGEGGVK